MAEICTITLDRENIRWCDKSHAEVWELTDARGIYCAIVCQQCEQEKKTQFRPEIFSDPNYHTDELINPEDI